MCKIISLVFYPESDVIKWPVVCKDNEKICGMSGSYPMTYHIEESDLRVEGIEYVYVDTSYPVF